MKRTKINLLTYKENYQQIERFFFFLRLFTIITIFVFTGVLYYFSTTMSKLSKKYNEVLERKKTLLSEINKKKETEAKIIYIKDKYTALNTFLKDDASILPYYNLLTSVLSQSTASAKLDDFHVDTQRNIDFKFSFQNLTDLIDFFKLVESDDFLKNFEKLTLGGITADKTSTSYSLSFTGKLIQVNENKD